MSDRQSAVRRDCACLFLVQFWTVTLVRFLNLCNSAKPDFADWWVRWVRRGRSSIWSVSRRPDHVTSPLALSFLWPDSGVQPLTYTFISALAQGPVYPTMLFSVTQQIGLAKIWKTQNSITNPYKTTMYRQRPVMVSTIPPFFFLLSAALFNLVVSSNNPMFCKDLI